MAVSIRFSKATAETFLEVLTQGRSVVPVDVNWWSEQELLALAGACHYLASSLGKAALLEADSAPVPAGTGEPIEHVLDGEVRAAIDWYAQATALVASGSYDELFEEEPRRRFQGQRTQENDCHHDGNAQGSRLEVLRAMVALGLVRPGHHAVAEPARESREAR